MLKNLLLLSGFSTFVVIVIIGLNIYHGYTVSSLPATTQKHVIPITPTFDKKTLEDLKKRTPISVNLQEKSGIVSEDSVKSALSPTPTQPATPQSQASQSAITTPTLPPATQP